VGEGDIVDANNSGYGCTLEQFQAQDTACTENEVSGDYFVNYKAEPRPGWRFVRWDGPCAPNSDFQHCSFGASKAIVDWWDETYPDEEIPPSTAVFAPITGNAGFLVGPAVAGVAWETPTQQGVTGLDGSFQYEEGETVRFMVGDTVLGEVMGREQVTPFDLAGSPVHTGIHITWALQEDEDEEDENDSFHTVVNLAVFLQSVDHDADPENGIQIRPGVASLLRRVSLDVSQHWETFQNESTLRRAIGQANRIHRFSVAHGIVRPAAALEHLYGALEIDARTLGVSLLQTRAVDSPESIVEERWQYDANGNVTRHEVDGEVPLPLELDVQGYESWQYDANGNASRYELHVQSHGSRSVQTWQYDANGNRTRYESDRGGDGTLNEIRSWHYDANDNVTRESSDEDGDGTPDYIESWQYNARGNMTRESSDEDGDGTPDGILSYEYDTAGNLTRTRYDSYGDGTLDYIEIETWQYDANDNVTQYRAEEDYDGDGTPDRFESWLYNANGNVTRFERYSELSSGRTRHVIESYEYDADGKLTRYTRDDDGDGRPDRIETLHYQYDANGNVIRKERVDEDNGTLEKIETWQYDANGNVTRYECDGDGDCEGGPWLPFPVAGHRLESWQYHANGKVMQHEIEVDFYGQKSAQYQYDANGNLTRHEEGGGLIETWQYDADGNLTRYEWDDRGDGEAGEATTYRYEATGWGHLFSGIAVFGHNSTPPENPRPDLDELE
jgi:YD repeat-containing protein